MTGSIVYEPPLAVKATVWPETGLPRASRIVAVRPIPVPSSGADEVLATSEQ
jgi:hypothetical protein